MATICLYQDSRHEDALLWIAKVLGAGYISRRKDGITELRINGYEQVQKILQDLKPFIRFKKKQSDILIRACALLRSKPYHLLSDREIKRLVGMVLSIRKENYKSRNALSQSELYKLLGLTP